MTQRQIAKEIGNKLNIDPDVVYKAYQIYWKFIKNVIENTDYDENSSKEEFESVKRNINLNKLGKFTFTYDRMLKLKKSKEIFKQLKEEGKC